MTLAELGQFDEAVSVQRGVIQAATRGGLTRDLRQMHANLLRYTAGASLSRSVAGRRSGAFARPAGRHLTDSSDSIATKMFLMHDAWTEVFVSSAIAPAIPRRGSRGRAGGGASCDINVRTCEISTKTS